MNVDRVDRRSDVGCGEAGDIISATSLGIIALVRDGASAEKIAEVAGGLDSIGWPENVKELFIKICIEGAIDG